VYEKEQVLVIGEAFTHKNFSDGKQFIDYEHIAEDFTNYTLYFRDRQETETNEKYKQIIPYIVFKAGEKYFIYNRGKQGGENRLADKFSLGIGGHVNDRDLTIKRGVIREISEEVGDAVFKEGFIKSGIADVPWTQFISFCKGFIYDNSTPVGRVHLGMLFIIEVKHIFDLRDSISSEIIKNNQWYAWMTLYQIMTDIYGVKSNFESWSRIILPWLH
jgi:predicted NUDIX family phosphoesterase